MLRACSSCSGSCSRPSWPRCARAGTSCSRTCSYAISWPSSRGRREPDRVLGCAPLTGCSRSWRDAGVPAGVSTWRSSRRTRSCAGIGRVGVWSGAGALPMPADDVLGPDQEQVSAPVAAERAGHHPKSLSRARRRVASWSAGSVPRVDGEVGGFGDQRLAVARGRLLHPYRAAAPTEAKRFLDTYYTEDHDPKLVECWTAPARCPPPWWRFWWRCRLADLRGGEQGDP
jgi:hypothetical protein